MRILFEQKKPGRNRQDIEPVPFDVEGKPETVGQLIEATVRSMVAAFNLRAAGAPADPDSDSISTTCGSASTNYSSASTNYSSASTTCSYTSPTCGSAPLEDDEIARLAETGRVAFGIVYNGKTADPNKAVEDALLAYDDGLFRMFLNGKPLGNKDDAIDLMEGDLVTVVRLTMLAGRMW